MPGLATGIVLWAIAIIVGALIWALVTEAKK